MTQLRLAISLHSIIGYRAGVRSSWGVGDELAGSADSDEQRGVAAKRVQPLDGRTEMEMSEFTLALDEAALITRFVERSARSNAALEHAARTSNVRMIRVNGDYSPDTLCTRVLNAIT